MKYKITLPFLLLTLIIVSFPSCKKGDNDPIISMHSRTKRITGNWIMTDRVIRYTNTSYYFDGYTTSPQVMVTNFESTFNGVLLTKWVVEAPRYTPAN